MCGHAGTVGTLRPVRRLPPPPGWPGAGRRPGQAAGAARASRRRPSAPRSPGWSGRAGCDPLRLASGPGYLAHPEGRPATRRGGRPDLPHRPDQLGRPVRPARAGRPRRPAGTGSGSPPTSASSATARSTSTPGWRTRPGEDVDALLAEAGVRLRAVHRRARRRHPGRDGRGPPRLGPGRDRPRVRAVRRRAAPAARPRSPCAAATRRRTRPGSGWCTRGVRSCSGTRSCPRRCCPSAGPAPRAASFFDRHAARLRPAADRYVDAVPRHGRPTADPSDQTRAVHDRPHDRAAARRPHRRRRHPDPEPARRR